MASFMGRAGSGSGAASRALDPLRSRLRPIGSQRTYLSISHLRSLHIELVSLLYSAGATSAAPTAASPYAPSISARQSRRLVEILRSIAELVAFGEAGEKPEYFEFFCEKATMALFVNALRLGPAIKTQVVQATSILFQNLRSPTSLYMLLSQDHINRLIQPDEGGAELPLDDEEFLTNYVALLKMISVRLSKDTVQFFFDATKGCFPLYSRSVPLIGHPDPMVRTSALNIVLHVLSVQDPGVTAFLALEENHRGFFHQLSTLMQDAYSQILCRMWQVSAPALVDSAAIDGATSFFQDMLYFLQDVLSVGGPLLSEKLASHLFRTFFRPVVLGGLVDGSQSRGAVTEEREPELQLALYALCQFFVLTTEGPLLGLVAAELFGEGSADAESKAEAAGVGGDGGADGGKEGAGKTAAPEREAVDSAGGSAPNGGGAPGGVGDDGLPRGGEDGGLGGGEEPGREGTGTDGTGPKNGEEPNNGSGKGPSGGGKGPGGCGEEEPRDCGDPGGGNEAPAKTGTETTAEVAVGEGGGAEDAGAGAGAGMEGEKKQGGSNPYRRALLSCAMWRRQQGGAGAQVRLGAIAVLRSAVKNPSAAAEIVIGGPAADGSIPVGGSGGCGSAAAVPSSQVHEPDTIAVFDGLARSISPPRRGGVGEAAVADGTEGGVCDSHKEGQELLSVASQASVLDFMLPDEERERPAVTLSGASLGSASAADVGEPSVLDFMLPGPTTSSSPPPPPAAPPMPASPSPQAVAPPRRKSYHIAAMLPGGSSPPEEDPPPRRKSYDLAGLQGGGSAGGAANDGFGPRPSKYLPRLERLWNGGGLLFSERGGDGGGAGGAGRGGGGGGGGGGAGGAGGGSDSFGGGAAISGSRQRSDCFEQVMVRLLEALTDPPAADTVAVRTAAAAVEELCVLEIYSWGSNGGTNCGSGGADENNVRSRNNASVAGDPTMHVLARGGLWGPGTRNRRFAAMLTEAYARSAESLLSTTTRLYPFALLAACEQAVELLGFGSFGSEGGFRLSSPHPGLADIAGSVLQLGDGVGARPGGGGGRGGGGVSRGGLASGEGGELPALRVQNFLVLRSLHQWLVEGKTPLHGQASAAAAAAAAAAAPLSISSLAVKAESLGPLELLSLPGSVRVDAEFLGLVGAAAAGGPDEDGTQGQDDTAGIYLFPSATTVPKKAAVGVSKEPEKAPAPKGTEAVGKGQGEAPAPATSLSTGLSSWYSWGGSFRRREAASPGPLRPGDRVRLSEKRCVACYLPYNWPGKPATAVSTPADANGNGGGGGWGGGLLVRGLRYGYSYWATPAAAPLAGSRVGVGGGGGGGGISNGAPANGAVVAYKQQQRRRRSSSPPPLPLDELYVLLDKRNFVVAVPDPDSPAADGGGLGIVVCVAPLRNTAAKRHPANPRVLELRVSTKEEGRAGPGSSNGPGLFLPVPGGAAWAGNGDREASFRGAGHRGIWHLVLCFQNPGACCLVAEGVEDQRGAVLAFPTVGLVEMFRGVASMSSSSARKNSSGSATDAAAFVK